MLVLQLIKQNSGINLLFEEGNVNPEFQKDFVSHVEPLLHPCNISYIPELHSSSSGFILRAQDQPIPCFIIGIITNNLLIIKMKSFAYLLLILLPPSEVRWKVWPHLDERALHIL